MTKTPGFRTHVPRAHGSPAFLLVQYQIQVHRYPLICDFGEQSLPKSQING
jgi:hypothetical protein